MEGLQDVLVEEDAVFAQRTLREARRSELGEHRGHVRRVDGMSRLGRDARLSLTALQLPRYVGVTYRTLLLPSEWTVPALVVAPETPLEKLFDERERDPELVRERLGGGHSREETVGRPRI
ncbi:MAG: hypothetical protein CMN31_23095 [Sandaracinus sp.]|nr:hypothetical protein [Myxococcales bacterium]MAT24823.1 hypothetical protein [Sandaracinus sp.]MBJ74177.1 hypothetical protein [Sandaracinus sp.]